MNDVSQATLVESRELDYDSDGYSSEETLHENEMESDSGSEYLPDNSSDDNSDSTRPAKKKSQGYRLLDSHPQYNTHLIKLCSKNNAKIPNLLGKPLPRSDKGNYENYCATMLTLFKPWRSGKDL